MDATNESADPTHQRKVRPSDLPADGIVFVAVPDSARTEEGNVTSSGFLFSIPLRAYAARDGAEAAGPAFHGGETPVFALDTALCDEGRTRFWISDSNPDEILIDGDIPSSALTPCDGPSAPAP